jgi:transcriptional regulator with XRE-family HTH domain
MRRRRAPYRGGMRDTNPLGEYLRARRALVRPEDAGVVVTGVRRTPGQRREEVATLAGISADYYLRLEQGRDRNPSTQVLDALARVLHLDAPAVAYLRGLASDAPSRPRPRRDAVPTGTAQLLTVLGLPAFVENRTFDVLAANPLATALSPAITTGANRLRSVLLDPAEQALLPDWHRAVGGMIASFRASVGPEQPDAATARLLAELTEAIDVFRTHWSRHDVRPLEGAGLEMDHPAVGRLDLRREKLAVGGTDGQLLVIYHAEPGSRSAERLALLGSLAAPAQMPAALNSSPST